MPIPSGDGEGEPWVVLPWQRRLFSAIERPGLQTIACSTSRGNGKTAVASLIARAYLPGGPMHTSRAEVVVVSATHQQAREVVNDLSAWREDGWAIANSPQVARVRVGDCQVRCIAARPQSLHGMRPSLLIADEMAQYQQAPRLYSAMRTSLGKRPGARLLAIGTRPEAGSGHVFDKLLNGGADMSLVYAASPADEKGGRLGWRRTWVKANPSMSVLPSLEDAIRSEWKDAQGDDEAMASFQALRLNMGVSEIASSILISPTDWQAIEENEKNLPPRSGPLVFGIDAGFSEAFSAICAYWPLTGRMEGLCCFPGIPGLRERARKDQVGGVYTSMVNEGSLLVQEGRRVPSMAVFVNQAIARLGMPDVIVADHFRRPELADALDASSMPRGRPFITRRTRWSESTEDIRRTRGMLLEGRVRVPRQVAWRQAMAETRVVADEGNVRLAVRAQAGRRARARTDLTSAMVMCLAEADRRGVPSERQHGLRLVAV